MPADRRGDVLLDTHALLWWQAGTGRLSSAALAAVTTARRVLVSPISCWEVAMLAGKGRIRLDRPVAAWVRDLFAQDRMGIADLTPAIAVGAAELPDFHSDPADRMLYSTARALQVPLISKDERLHRYAGEHRDGTVHW